MQEEKKEAEIEEKEETRNKRMKEERKGDFLLDFKESEQKQTFIKICWIVPGKVARLIPLKRDGFAYSSVPVQYSGYNKCSISKPTFF